jgi:error-prone DNA polymerase
MTLPLSDPHDVPVPVFLPLGAGDTVAWDYRTSSHSVRGHPIASLRPTLRRQGLADARTVQARLSGTRVHYAGLVTHRQRPQTASGVTFMTLEDETGFVNLVVWDRVFQKFSVLVRTASLLGVTGVLEVQGSDETHDKIVHLIAQRLWVPRDVTMRESIKSRDFH